jgi:hypothetical protein
MPKTTQRRWMGTGPETVAGGGVTLASAERAASDYGAWRYVKRDRRVSDKREDLRSLSQRTGRDVTALPPVIRKRRYQDSERKKPVLSVTETIVARLERETAERARQAQTAPFTRPDAPYRAFGVGAPRERR